MSKLKDNIKYGSKQTTNLVMIIIGIIAAILAVGVIVIECLGYTGILDVQTTQLTRLITDSLVFLMLASGTFTFSIKKIKRIKELKKAKKEQNKYKPYK